MEKIKQTSVTDGPYYEVDGAVFKAVADGLEVFSDKEGAFKPYAGDVDRVKRLSNPMALEEVQPFMGKPNASPTASAGAEPSASDATTPIPA